MSSERVAWFILTQLNRKFGNQWLGGPVAPRSRAKSKSPAAHASARILAKNDSELLNALQERNILVSRAGRAKLEHLDRFSQLFENFYLRTVREDSQRALVSWMNEEYPLDLLDYIPQPIEMLKAQCEGRRFVTLLEDEEDWDRPIGRHQGSLAFLLHDLEHADKFWSDPASHRGQLKFFRKLHSTLDAFENMRADNQFAKEFDYVLADMNSHPLHLFKYLKAIVLMHFLRERRLTTRDALPAPQQEEFDQFWRTLLERWQFSPEEMSSGLRINRPQIELPGDGQTVSDFFIHKIEEAP